MDGACVTDVDGIGLSFLDSIFVVVMGDVKGAGARGRGVVIEIQSVDLEDVGCVDIL